MTVLRGLRLAFFKFAASGYLPARWFEPDLPPVSVRAAKTGRLHVEVVSHCWNYSHMLVYQLSSLVLHPPAEVDVTMTVFYSPEDERTQSLLAFFSGQTIKNIRWNWQPLPRQKLFRRSIGRNSAALSTKADWVWFTDCDLVFHEGCLDTLCSLLQGKREALYFPDEERCTDLLEEDSPMLKAGAEGLQLLEVDTSSFVTFHPTRATGPLQITHGDVCRAIGYCRSIGVYQEPEESFAKCHEDRAFRWLLRSQGVSLPVPGVYRIRHVKKGRYSGSEANTALRTQLRQMQAKRRDPTANKDEA